MSDEKDFLNDLFAESEQKDAAEASTAADSFEEFWPDYRAETVKPAAPKKAETPPPAPKKTPAPAQPAEKRPVRHAEKMPQPARPIRNGVTVSGTELNAEEDEEERNYRPIRFRRDGKTGCLGGLMYFLFVCSVSVMLACLAWMAASDVLGLNKDEATATVVVEKNYEQQEITDDDTGETELVEVLSDEEMDSLIDQLKDNGLIEYKFLFRLFTSFSHANQKISPGTYVLSTKYDYRALVANMSVGSEAMVQTRITFPEGFTLDQIFDRLEENEVCSKEDLMEAAAEYNYTYTFLEGVERGEASSLEGFLFPDTYDFYQGSQASSVINKLLLVFHGKMTAEMYDKAAARGLTVQQVVTIASMVEKEAANDEERADIASVIYNRLAAGMPLQVDATSLYLHPDHEGAPTQEMLDDASDPYNTRINTGLPPTPICNPGAPSLNAAFSPNDTNYYYYALDTETGTHRFFTNSSDFEAFVATQTY